MINGKTVLAVIPARGGSKGVPRKNIREVNGKPLIAYTIEEASKSAYIDRLILTSDDAEIIKVAEHWGCEAPFVRPDHLSQDDTPGIDPVLHAVEQLPGYDYVILLQPTSPLRSVEDIDGCLSLCVEKEADSCVTVTPASKSPFWMYDIREDGSMKPIMDSSIKVARRQDAPAIHVLNGAVYVARISWLCKQKGFIGERTVGYIMPESRSLDIDTEMDLKLMEFIVCEQANLSL